MNGLHADPDNVFKGIADALFKNDKFLDGSFVSDYAPDSKGRVEISITINV
jgi:Holliday junction resolvase RusA-like endonuclease